MSNFTQSKTNKKAAEEYNESIMPFYVSQKNTGYFTSIKVGEESLNKLQELIAKKLKEGGKFVFKIRGTEANAEGDSTPNAWLEYMSPEKVAAFQQSRKFSPSTNNATNTDDDL